MPQEHPLTSCVRRAQPSPEPPAQTGPSPSPSPRAQPSPAQALRGNPKPANPSPQHLVCEPTAHSLRTRTHSCSWCSQVPIDIVGIQASLRTRTPSCSWCSQVPIDIVGIQALVDPSSNPLASNIMLQAIVILFLLVLSSTTATASQVSPFNIVHSLISERPANVKLLWQGAPYEEFERPLPQLVDPSILQDFEDSFSLTQDFYSNGDNKFTPEGAPFVASISEGRVTGVLGAVYDGQGNLFSELDPSAVIAPELVAAFTGDKCKRFKRLATGIQKYGHMYYHFLQEVLPQVLMLKPFLDEDTKLLMFGASYEQGWLDLIGIPSSMIEIYDPSEIYCAEELLVPSSTTVITPSKEGFMRLRDAVGASDALPVEERNLIIYCSREGAAERQVANEEQMLDEVKSHFPSEEFVVFSGAGMSPANTVSLFKRAKVVVGVHGAGMSHVTFAAPGTAVVELLFMADPPLMFWHASGAIGLRYVMLPLPQSWWLDSHVDVPRQDLLDVMSLALGLKDTTGCPSGSAMVEGECEQCHAGTYRFAPGSASCLPCPAGKVSPDAGAGSCSICPKSTISDKGVECIACYEGYNTLFPGSSQADQCKSQDELDTILGSMFTPSKLAKKLVAVPALERQARSVEHRLSRSFFFRSLLAKDLSDIRSSQLRMLYVLFQSQAQPLQGPASHTVMTDENEAVQRGSYSNGRRLASYGGRVLNSYGSRQLASYGTRQLTSYGTRQLSGYGSRRSLSTYGTRQLSGYGSRRSLSSYGTRQLSGYGSKRSLSSRGLLSYGSSVAAKSVHRHLQSYGSQLPAVASTQPVASDQHSSMLMLGSLYHRLLIAFTKSKIN
eukprot:gene8682-34129_t